VPSGCQGRPLLVFISPQTNIAVSPLTGQISRATDASVVPPTDAASVHRSYASTARSLPRVPLQIRAIDLQRSANFNALSNQPTDASHASKPARPSHHQMLSRKGETARSCDRRICRLCDRRGLASIALAHRSRPRELIDRR
jgi:hypothetical protein